MVWYFDHIMSRFMPYISDRSDRYRSVYSFCCNVTFGLHVSPTHYIRGSHIRSLFFSLIYYFTYNSIWIRYNRYRSVYSLVSTDSPSERQSRYNNNLLQGLSLTCKPNVTLQQFQLIPHLTYSILLCPYITFLYIYPLGYPSFQSGYSSL